MSISHQPLQNEEKKAQILFSVEKKHEEDTKSGQAASGVPLSETKKEENISRIDEVLTEHFQTSDIVVHRQTEPSEQEMDETFAKRLCKLDQSNRYSEKKRKKLLASSRELKRKLVNLPKQEDYENMPPKKAYEAEKKRISIESEARIAYLRATSVSQDAEDYAVGMEEIHREYQLRDLYAKYYQEPTEEKLIKENQKFDEQLEERRKNLQENPFYIEHRNRIIDAARNSVGDRKAEDLIEKVREMYGDESAGLLTVREVTQYVEKQLENDDTRCIDEMFEDIRQFKEQMGGSPNYSGDPRLADESSSFSIVSKEAAKAWADTQIRKGNFFMKMIGQMTNNVLGLGAVETDYERVNIYLDSMRRLALYKTTILNAFEDDLQKQKADTEAYKQASKDGKIPRSEQEAIFNKYSSGAQLLLELTRLTAHNKDNGAAVEKMNVEASLSVLSAQYRLAKQEGRLLEFFNALDGVCFDDRVRQLLEYAQDHEVPQEQEENGEEQQKDEREPLPDGALYIKSQKAIDRLLIGENSTTFTAVTSYMTAIAKANDIEDPGTLKWSQILPELRRLMIGQKMVDSQEAEAEMGAVPTEVTEEALERIHEYLDMLCMIGDEEENA